VSDILRFAALDIETTSLEASYGRLICACYKFTDEDSVRTITVPRYRNEAKALERISRLYDKLDVVLTWNGKLFDIPFLNARLMHHKLPPLDARKMHLDIMYQARKLRLRGSRMDGVSKDLRTKVAKYDVPAWRWVLAAEGNREAIGEIVRHCELDVILTEELFDRLKPLIVRITR
jgi:uncharacterized protein YprB with RNaseH-like and TPR domain